MLGTDGENRARGISKDELIPEQPQHERALAPTVRVVCDFKMQR